MNRELRKQLVNKLATQLSNSGIAVAQSGDVGVEPSLAALDEFMTEYLQLQIALGRVKSLVQHCLGPTREVKTQYLKECVDILTELVDKDEPVTNEARL